MERKEEKGGMMTFLVQVQNGYVKFTNYSTNLFLKVYEILDPFKRKSRLIKVIQPNHNEIYSDEIDISQFIFRMEKSPHEMKLCTECLKEKSLEDFHPQKHGKLGRRSACRVCFKKRVNIYNEKRADVWKLYKKKEQKKKEKPDVQISDN